MSAAGEKGVQAGDGSELPGTDSCLSRGALGAPEASRALKVWSLERLKVTQGPAQVAALPSTFQD